MVMPGRLNAITAAVKQKCNLLILSLLELRRGPLDRESTITADLLWLDARELHDFGPFFCIIRDELAELGWRASIHNTAKTDKPRLHLGIGQRGVDLLVELVDDLGGRASGRANTLPRARFEAWHEISLSRQLRQRLRPGRRRYRERTHSPTPDLFNRP